MINRTRNLRQIVKILWVLWSCVSEHKTTKCSITDCAAKRMGTQPIKVVNWLKFVFPIFNYDVHIVIPVLLMLHFHGLSAWMTVRLVCLVAKENHTFHGSNACQTRINPWRDTSYGSQTTRRPRVLEFRSRQFHYVTRGSVAPGNCSLPRRPSSGALQIVELFRPGRGGTDPEHRKRECEVANLANSSIALLSLQETALLSALREAVC